MTIRDHINLIESNQNAPKRIDETIQKNDYFYITKPFSATNAKNPKLVHEFTSEDLRFPYRVLDTVPTGLVAPHPTTVTKIYGYYPKKWANDSGSFLVTSDIVDAGIRLFELKQGTKVRLLQNCKGKDNSYNSPSGIEYNAGEIFEVTDSYGTNRGDFFMKDSQGRSVHLFCTFVPGPGAAGLADPRFLEVAN